MGRNTPKARQKPLPDDLPRIDVDILLVDVKGSHPPLLTAAAQRRTHDLPAAWSAITQSCPLLIDLSGDGKPYFTPRAPYPTTW